jgi:hypothetical protein
MNEHPLDFDHQEECEYFAELYEQARKAGTRADMLIRQDDILYKQARLASKHYAAAHRRSIAADKHAAALQSTSQSATARKDAAAAVACHLFRKRQRLWRLAAAFTKKSRAAGAYADDLSIQMKHAFKAVFSGNKARLL